MAQSLTGGFEMKTYTITVNGTAYDVTVEEGTGSAAACTPLAAPPLRR